MRSCFSYRSNSCKGLRAAHQLLKSKKNFWLGFQAIISFSFFCNLKKTTRISSHRFPSFTERHHVDKTVWVPIKKEPSIVKKETVKLVDNQVTTAQESYAIFVYLPKKYEVSGSDSLVILVLLATESKWFLDMLYVHFQIVNKYVDKLNE